MAGVSQVTGVQTCAAHRPAVFGKRGGQMEMLASRNWAAANGRAPAAIPGFSLIELLAALAIMSLLLALAVPAYHGHVVRAKRVQGQAALLRLMQQQERYYSQNNRYLAFSSASPAPQAQAFPWWSGEGGAAGSAYEIEALACPGLSIGQCVLLRATPGTSKVDAQFQDADCGVLSLSSTGQRGSSGPASHCWF
jgi:type IV pilus assembly protein PilE